MNGSIKVLRISHLEEKTGLSRSSIWKRVKAGTFPQPIELGVKARGWKESIIDEWLANCPTAQNKQSGAGV